MLFLFDEMANICPLPDFDQLISTCRGLNIRIMTIWQDLSQIEERYGENKAGTIL
ncbi:TRAG protein, partial [mine drainage metagenome]